MLSAENNAPRASVPARWLPLIRLAWLAIGAAVLAVFVTHFAMRSALLTVETPAYAPALATLNVSTGDFRTAIGVLDAGTMLAFSAVALLLFWRKSNEWIGLLASLALLTFGAMPTFLRYAMRGMWDSGDAAVLALGTALSIAVLCIFPDGHFYPRWSRLLTALICAWAVTWPLFPGLNPFNWGALAAPVLAAWYAVATAALVYRYRRTASGPQRQQMKWVMYAIVVQMLTWVLGIVPVFALRGSLAGQAYSLAGLLGGSLITLGQFLVPLAFGIAILRYKLWDIDLIINRTLVYLPLTGILAGVYAASTATSQKLAQAFTGQKSDGAVVLTTLLIVAIFAPLKDRLQRAVDRRYREPKDPLADVESFGSQVSHVVDVFDAGRITQQALQTAATALRARGGVVYLEQDGQRRLVHACGEWTAPEAGLEIPIEAHGRRLGCLQLAARLDGAPYSARDREVLRQTLAQVGLAIYLASIRRQPVDALDEW